MKWPEKLDILKRSPDGNYRDGWNAAIEACKAAWEKEPNSHNEFCGIKDGNCYVCGDKTESLGANPSLWAIFLPHIDGQTKHRFYHIKCLYPVLTRPVPTEPMTSEKDRVREGLIEYLYILAYRVEYGTGKESMNLGAIADFIIADRKRIVQPLIDSDRAKYASFQEEFNSFMKAKEETLSNAGYQRTENG